LLKAPSALYQGNRIYHEGAGPPGLTWLSQAATTDAAASPGERSGRSRTFNEFSRLNRRGGAVGAWHGACGSRLVELPKMTNMGE